MTLTTENVKLIDGMKRYYQFIWLVALDGKTIGYVSRQRSAGSVVAVGYKAWGGAQMTNLLGTFATPQRALEAVQRGSASTS